MASARYRRQSRALRLAGDMTPPRGKPAGAERGGPEGGAQADAKPLAADPNRLLLGHISAAHGIKGDVLIKTFTGAPEAIGDYGPLFDEAGGRSFVLERVRVTPKGVVAHMAGIADRNAAEALKGTRLYVPRDRLPKAEEGAYYHSDLIGLAVVDRAGCALGAVTAVENFGAGDLIEVRLTESGRSVLVPFTDERVPEVDLAARRLVIDVIPGLLD